MPCTTAVTMNYIHDDPVRKIQLTVTSPAFIVDKAYLPLLQALSLVGQTETILKELVYEYLMQMGCNADAVDQHAFRALDRCDELKAAVAAINSAAFYIYIVLNG
jgi:hypothetical protein